MKKQKRVEKKVVYKNLHQFVFIEDVPVEEVGAALVLWAQAPWWPKKCALNYIAVSEGPVQSGHEFKLRLSGVFGKKYRLQVKRVVADRLVERIFTEGPLRGIETINAEERSNGTRVNFELQYVVPGLLNKLVWAFFLRPRYERAMKVIMKSLSAFCIKNYESRKEA